MDCEGYPVFFFYMFPVLRGGGGVRPPDLPPTASATNSWNTWRLVGGYPSPFLMLKKKNPPFHKIGGEGEDGKVSQNYWGCRWAKKFQNESVLSSITHLVLIWRAAISQQMSIFIRYERLMRSHRMPHSPADFQQAYRNKTPIRWVVWRYQLHCKIYLVRLSALSARQTFFVV